MDLMAAIPRLGVVMVVAGSVVAWRGVPEATAVEHPPLAHPAGESTAIAGVVASADGAPLSGAVVQGCGAQTETGGDGSYVLEPTTAPPCVVTVQAGARAGERTIAADLAEEASVDFTLAQASTASSP